jgi:hypothetical protein
MQCYNGFSPEQRLLKARAMTLALATGALATPAGPCELCGNPDVPVEFHDEDYSEPFKWEAPAAYRICHGCHRRVHLRFGSPIAWQAFLAHVRRGGYARDLLNPAICAELGKYQRRLAQGRSSMRLAALRDYPRVAGAEWFAHLRIGSDAARQSQLFPDADHGSEQTRGRN